MKAVPAVVAAAAAVLALAACGGDGDAAPPDPEVLEEGRALFTGDAGCAGCHTLADAGAQGNVGPSLDVVQPDADDVAQRVRVGVPTLMPAYQGVLADAEIEAIAAYVAEVAGS